MLISICIPHYNRAEYLLKVLDSILEQTFKNIEVVISDDCSTDDSHICIPEYIKRISYSYPEIKFKYIRQPNNLGYDANLRASLGAGTGDYLFILGNDDGLNGMDAIQKLIDHIKEYELPEVIFCNYSIYGDESNIQKRTNSTKSFGSGPEIAVKLFRCFSFVGGIIIKKDSFKKYNSNLVDGSIYFQIYLATKIISSGGVVSSIIDPLVLKDIKVNNIGSNSYLDSLKIKNKKLHAETGGLNQVFRVTYLGIKDSLCNNEENRLVRNIYKQILTFTYPIWLITYRDAGVYKASINLAIGNWPAHLVKIRLSILNYIHIYLIYFLFTIGGLIIPIKLILRYKDYLRKISKRN